MTYLVETTKAGPTGDPGTEPGQAAEVAGASPAGITLTGIGKSYGGPRDALDVPRLAIPAGSFTVVVGPSGCGKSTGLRVIAGLETPDRGSVLIEGTDVTGLPPGERGVAMVFQDFALYPHMTVEHNISFGLRLAAKHDRRGGPRRDEISSRVADVCARLGLSELRGRLPGQLSGGERQRVGLARAIVRHPAVLLLDEPLSALDAQLRQRARAELVRLHRELRNTVVLVTHDQLEALSMGTNLVVMNRGRVVQSGPPADVFRYPADTFVATFLGSPPMNLHAVTPVGDGRILTGPGLAARLPTAAGPVLLGWRPADGLLEPLGPDLAGPAGVPTPGGPAPVALADQAGPARAGEPAVPGEPGIVLHGVVDVVEFTGDGTVVTCVGPGNGIQWAVSLRGIDNVPAVGAPVRVRVPAERIHLFDQDSGVRLGAGPRPGGSGI